MTDRSRISQPGSSRSIVRPFVANCRVSPPASSTVRPVDQLKQFRSGLRPRTTSMTFACNAPLGGKTGGPPRHRFPRPNRPLRPAPVRRGCGISATRVVRPPSPSWHPSTQGCCASSFLSLASLSGVLPGQTRQRTADLQPAVAGAQIGAWRHGPRYALRRECRCPRLAAWAPDGATVANDGNRGPEHVGDNLAHAGLRGPPGRVQTQDKRRRPAVSPAVVSASFT